MAVYNDKNHPNKSKEGDVFTIRMVSRSGLLIFNITFVVFKEEFIPLEVQTIFRNCFY